MTLQEALQLGRQRMQTAGVPDFEYDANALLQAASGRSLAVIFGNPGEELPPEREQQYMDMLARRAKRVPLQHILGEACFYGYTFHTRPGALIPRGDTEHLVMHALRLAPKRELGFLDLCTGSGCIGISFWLERRKMGFTDQGVLSDISPEALNLAEENAHLLEADVEVRRSDLFDGLSGMRFDLILSNPPYISLEEMDELMPEVKYHDPRLALTDEGDGLSFYRRIAHEAGSYLKQDGYLVLEIGFAEGQAVTELLQAAGFEDVECHKDYAGLDRVITARRA